MVKIQLNLDEIGTARTLVPAGRYQAKVTGIEETESQSGNPMLTWTWEIVGTELAGTELKSYTSLQEHALFGLKTHLEAFGASGEIDFDTDAIIGKMATLVVILKTIQNRDTGEPMDVNRINSVLPAEKKSGILPSAKGPIKGPVKSPIGKGPVKKPGKGMPF